MIKTPTVEELKELIKIYKQSFENHNIFNSKESEILEYLENKNVFVESNNGKVWGGVVIKQTQVFGAHSVWKINHLAVLEKYRGRGIGKSLVRKAEEEIVRRADKSVKIEISVAEKSMVRFFKKLGYRLEGELKSHFRYGELVYALGKEIIK